MMSLALEREHLAKSNLDIAEGEQRIRDQTRLIEKLRCKGAETDAAELLLLNLQQTLGVWKAHREQIRQTIVQLEHPSAP